MANTRKNTRRAERKNRKSRRAERKSRRASRRNRRAERKSRRNTRRNRRNNMIGGKVRVATRVARPVQALAKGASNTAGAALLASKALLNNIVKGASNVVGKAAKGVNSTASALFAPKLSRRNRSNRRH